MTKKGTGSLRHVAAVVVNVAVVEVWNAVEVEVLVFEVVVAVVVAILVVVLVEVAVEVTLSAFANAGPQSNYDLPESGTMRDLNPKHILYSIHDSMIPADQSR